MADELKRRLVHASGSGLVFLYLLADWFTLGVTWERFRVLMAVLLIGTLALEALRLWVGLDWWIYDKLTREYEQEHIAGYGLYMVGMTVVVLTFDPNVALPAMLMLAIGDPISGALSDDTLRAVKRPRVLVAMFLVCTVLAWPFLPPSAAIAAALAATIADGFTLKIGDYIVDDNLTIPIYAAIAAYVLLGIPSPTP